MTAEIAQADEQPAVMMVAVTNRNEGGPAYPAIKDMFNGVPVVFPFGVTVDVSTDIATHCFGWPGEDMDRATHMARRYGWGGRENLEWIPGTQFPKYHEWAMKVEIKPIYFDLVRRKPSDPIPADDGQPDDDPPPRIEAAETGTTVGKRKRKAATPPRRLRDRHETGERVR